MFYSRLNNFLWCRCESCHGQAERLLDSAKEMEDSIAVNLRFVICYCFIFFYYAEEDRVTNKLTIKGNARVIALIWIISRMSCLYKKDGQSTIHRTPEIGDLSIQWLNLVSWYMVGKLGGRAGCPRGIFCWIIDNLCLVFYLPIFMQWQVFPFLDTGLFRLSHSIDSYLNSQD